MSAIIDERAGESIRSAAPTKDHPDAELLRLGRELKRAKKAVDATYKAWEGIDTQESEDLTSAASAICSRLVDAILVLPARSLAGLQVKAFAVSWCYGGDPIDLDGETTDVQLAQSIIRDLLALGPLQDAA